MPGILIIRLTDFICMALLSYCKKRTIYRGLWGDDTVGKRWAEAVGLEPLLPLRHWRPQMSANTKWRLHFIEMNQPNTIFSQNVRFVFVKKSTQNPSHLFICFFVFSLFFNSISKGWQHLLWQKAAIGFMCSSIFFREVTNSFFF